MELTPEDKKAVDRISEISRQQDMDISGARIRRTSSRFCLGVEHGDYNGTPLFGVGTDRFIWMAYKPSRNASFRLFSGNFPEDGVINFKTGDVPGPKSKEISDTWARFAYGAEYILRKKGYKFERGIEAIIYGNIPGGGMSRSASLSLNLILSLLDANNIEIEDQFEVVDMAQAIENDYIGSPCGKLDQIMVLFARADKGTYYNPADQTIEYVPLGKGADDFRIMVMDTGTVRPGLEKSTYKIRRRECQQLVGLLRDNGYDIACLADIKDCSLYEKIMNQFSTQNPDLCQRLSYIYNAQKRFDTMLDAWRKGDIETVGEVFRQDGIELRDLYQISGPQLETMCDIVRSIPGVLGERMLGGGDKGASGALLKAKACDAVVKAVQIGYPRSHPEYQEKYAVHTCRVVDGVKIFDGIL